MEFLDSILRKKLWYIYLLKNEIVNFVKFNENFVIFISFEGLFVIILCVFIMFFGLRFWFYVNLNIKFM